MRLARRVRMGTQPTRSASALPQAEIDRIAAEIARAFTDPPPGDWRYDILARRHELPPDDEDRVIAALLRRRQG